MLRIEIEKKNNDGSGMDKVKPGGGVCVSMRSISSAGLTKSVGFCHVCFMTYRDKDSMKINLYATRFGSR